MAITHVVLFSFKPDISDADKEHALNSLREIKDKALHPTTGKPLATSFTGGKNNSPKNFNKGYEYAFTWGFDSAEDRDYYTFKDPYHTLITPIVLNAVENVVVVDYTAGEW